MSRWLVSLSTIRLCLVSLSTMSRCLVSLPDLDLCALAADTVRARKMNEAGTGEATTRGLVQTAQLIYQENGVAGLFAGVGPRVLWLSLGGTVFFSSLEAVKNMMPMQ